MIEVKVSITAPELCEAITKLAEALSAHPGGAVAVTGAIETAVSGSVEAPPASNPEPVASPPAPAATPATQEPSAPAKTYTADQLGRAGAELMSAGKMPDLIALLGQFGVRALTELKPDSYPAFAEGLIKLGAVIPAEAA